MFSNYCFLFLSFMLICPSITHSMNIESLPQEYQEYLEAIFKGNNEKAERILRENPTIDSNIIYPKQNIPHTVYCCYSSDNSYMLRVLIDQGLDTSRLGSYLYWAVAKRQINFRPKFFKVLVEWGALKQLTPEQQLDILNSLLFLPAAHKQEAITCALNNGLDKTIIKKHLIELFKRLANDNKQEELDAYATYAARYSNIYGAHLRADKSTKESVVNRCSKALANHREILDILKKTGSDLALKTPDYKELLRLLANEGSTDLAKYLIQHNGMITNSDLENIITHAREQAQEDDLIASKFIDELKESYTNQQEAIIQDTLSYLKKQWCEHKNKSVVKLLRQFALVQYLLKKITTPEIAHKIAQYAITDLQDQKFDYLPSYEKVEKFTEQKLLEHASLNQA